jgi:hypothetical protein
VQKLPVAYDKVRAACISDYPGQLSGGLGMKRNVGGKDHTARLMIASAGLAIGLFAKRGWIKALAFSIGGAELATAIAKYSLLNRVLNRNTHHLKDQIRQAA